MASASVPGTPKPIVLAKASTSLNEWPTGLTESSLGPKVGLSMGTAEKRWLFLIGFQASMSETEDEYAIHAELPG